MKILSYALAGMMAFQLITATPAQAVQTIGSVYTELANKRASAAEVEKAFRRCAGERGWRFQKTSAGRMIGKLTVRGKHYVEVDVVFNASEYQITYRDSRNMRYNAKANTIHKRYNSWVKNMDNDVQFCLS